MLKNNLLLTSGLTKGNRIYCFLCFIESSFIARSSMQIPLVGKVINSGYLLHSSDFWNSLPILVTSSWMSPSLYSPWFLEQSVRFFLNFSQLLSFPLNFFSVKGQVPETSMLDEIWKANDLRNNHTWRKLISSCSEERTWKCNTKSKIKARTW